MIINEKVLRAIEGRNRGCDDTEKAARALRAFDAAHSKGSK